MSLVNPLELEMYVYMVEPQKAHSLEIWTEVNNYFPFCCEEVFHSPGQVL